MAWAPPKDSYIFDIVLLAKDSYISFCFAGRNINPAAHWLASKIP